MASQKDSDVVTVDEAEALEAAGRKSMLAVLAGHPKSRHVDDAVKYMRFPRIAILARPFFRWASVLDGNVNCRYSVDVDEGDLCAACAVCGDAYPAGGLDADGRCPRCRAKAVRALQSDASGALVPDAYIPPGGRR